MLQTSDAEQFLNGQTPEQVFEAWYQEAHKLNLQYPNAMALSTIGADGFPTSRIVLCKEIREGQLIFFTNYQSAKGRDIERNNKVALNFYWDPLFRQVKFRGTVAKTTRQESDSYWQTRPRGSQLSQYVSKQSAPLASREKMDELVAQADAKFKDSQITCPEHWGGYIFTPTYVEFWIGQSNRFHDRFTYQKVEGKWVGKRLYP
jgi:pyridoxamine 5'-phosphate oxidase